MSVPARSIAGLMAACLVLAACGSSPGPTQGPGGTGPGTGSTPPTGTPPATPTVGIEHPTGAAELVFRYGLEGGFLPIEFVATRTPSLSLFGDGTLIVTPAGAAIGDPSVPLAPLRMVRLDEAAVQRLLELALTDGGLAVARERYDQVGVMDASTTVFEVHAGGLDRTVRVLALEFEDPQVSAETPARTAFRRLAGELDDLIAAAARDGVAYAPEAALATLFEQEAGAIGGPPVIDWPWPDLAPDDFAPSGDPNDLLGLPIRALDAAELEAAGITDVGGGVAGPVLRHEGREYRLLLRPLMPDEAP